MHAEHPALRRLQGEKPTQHRALLEYVETRNQAETARRTGFSLSTIRWQRKRWQWDTRCEAFDHLEAEAAKLREEQHTGLTREAEEMLAEARERARRLSSCSDLALKLAEKEMKAALEDGRQVQLTAITALLNTAARAVSQVREETGIGEALEALTEQLETTGQGRASSWRSK